MTELIEKLKAEHGDVLFHQSGGCCDGSAPMCFPANEFMVGHADVKLGAIASVPFYMSESQFEYWQHTQLIIDCVPGNGGMFSLEVFWAWITLAYSTVAHRCPAAVRWNRPTARPGWLSTARQCSR